MEEQVENSNLDLAINSVKEIAKNLIKMDETRTTVQEEYHHKDCNIRKDKYVLANNIAVKVTEVVDK